MLITVQPNPSWQLSLAQLSPSLFLSIFSYLTTSSSAAIMPSPPWSRTGSPPSRDRSRFTVIRSGLGSSCMSASLDHSGRRAGLGLQTAF